ncbi:MAG: spirocyclase AveC family protein, partial [Solirubrobacteraceae bacterium]
GYRSWRDGQTHRALIVMLAVTVLSLMDPPANWVTYTVFDPRFLHFDTAWAWINTAPLIEPLPNVPGYPMYYGLVGLTAAWLIRKFMATDRARNGWAGAHPLWAGLGIGFLVGIVWDIPTELFMIRAHMYFYSETWGPSITIDHEAYPIVWGFFTWSSIALATVMLVPDDRGRSQLLASASAWIARRRGRGPAVSVRRELLAGVVILAAGYLLCYALYGTLRVTGTDQPSANNRWPYTETKIYDPYHHWRDKGLPGPYYQ